MKKKLKAGAGVPRVDPYLEGLMAKLLERLVGLEKKMDVLIAQTAERPSGGGDQAKGVPSSEVKLPSRRERVLYEAICADCHQVCEVPFRPSEARPVYCKKCFAKRKGGGSGPAYPVLTPVAMPSKASSKTPVETAMPVPRGTIKKAKKSQAVKKSKKKR